jgi:hypothetical protein
VNISGHPPFPTGSKQFSGNSGNLIFLAFLEGFFRIFRTFGHLILWCGLTICHQNKAEAQEKDVAIWAWEPLVTKSRKGRPQPTELRTEKRWTVLGQPFQATIKQGHKKDKGRHWEVVQLP